MLVLVLEVLARTLVVDAAEGEGGEAGLQLWSEGGGWHVLARLVTDTAVSYGEPATT